SGGMRLFYTLTKLATPIFGLAWFLFGALPVLAVDYHITGDVIWSGEGAPIVYGDNNDGIDNVVVDENSSLTILPGTVVKMGWWGKIKVLGKLNIAGTAERPVVLTRLSDTENGAEYVPQAILDDYKQPGNWAGILVDRRGTVKGELNMKYAKILYSDGPLSSYGTTTIESSLFSHNTSWIRSIDSSFIMHNSAILDETGNSGLYLKKAASPSGGGIFACSFDSENVLVPMYDVSKNYWGADGGPCLVVNEDGSTDEERYGDCAGRTKLDFYPAGFKSEVSYQPFLASMPEWLSGVENKEPVILIPGILGSWGSDEEWILDPVLNTYTNLYEALKLAGYEEGKTLFAMPYNWRESNVDTAYLLKDKVEAVKRIAGTGRVNLIAHSMGGLVARYYAQELDGAKNIDKLIFLATPQRGSPKSYLAVEGGDVGIELSDFFVEMALKNEAEERGYSSLGDYIRNKPLESVKQLLPVYDYLSYGGQELNYPNNYPRNTFLEQLNSTASLQKLKDYVGVYNFVGLVKGDDGLFDASSTYAGFKLQAYASSSANGNWADGMPVNYLTSKTDGVVYNYGDGTVPSESNRQFLGLEAIPVYADHTSMVSGSQNRVIKILTGVEPVEEVNRTKAHNFLFFTIFSPADFMITAPDGKRIGRNIDGAGKIEEISGAYYSGFNTDREVVIIPNPLAGE
ncbi:MAG: alpha/beta fold hydrolase, partial [bacterium]